MRRIIVDANVLMAGADRLVTLNTKDFTPAVAQATGLVIQTPGDFMQNIRRLVAETL